MTRQRPWSYFVDTHDVPVGIGTRVESWPRERRYAVLRSLGERERPVSEREETTDE